MNLADIAKRRLLAQGLVEPKFQSPAEVVAALGAVQAQDYLAALWAVASRTPNSTEQAIEAELSKGTIVRTSLLRGTLHFVAPGDIRWLLSLLAPRLIRGAAGRHRQLGLDEDTFRRSRTVLEQALGGRQLTRDEVYATLQRAGIDTAGQRGYHILWRLALEGVLCYGPRSGKQPTFALLKEWIPAGPHPSREEALYELARRYFTGHGPATLKDFIWWSGLTTKDAKLALASTETALHREVNHGVEYWMSRATAASSCAESPIHLLAAFDEILLGYSDRCACLDPVYKEVIVPGGNGMFLPILVLDGRVVGTWKRTLRAKHVDLSISPFLPLGPDCSSLLTSAMERYGRFLAREVTFQSDAASGETCATLQRR